MVLTVISQLPSCFSEAKKITLYNLCLPFLIVQISSFSERSRERERRGEGGETSLTLSDPLVPFGQIPPIARFKFGWNCTTHALSTPRLEKRKPDAMLRGRTAAEKFRDLYIATCQDVGIEPAPSVLEQLRHTPETITKLDLSAHHLQSKVRARCRVLDVNATSCRPVMQLRKLSKKTLYSVQLICGTVYWAMKVLSTATLRAHLLTACHPTCAHTHTHMLFRVHQYCESS